MAKEPGLRLLFLESECSDPAVIAANVELKVSMGDPDYAGMSREDARADFLRRIKQYEDSYQPIADGPGAGAEKEEAYSFLKIINVGKQVTANHIHGYLQSRIAYYLMNLHLKPRSIYFSRVSPLRRSLLRMIWAIPDVIYIHNSMGKVNTTSREKSEATHHCQPLGGNTPMPYLRSSTRSSVKRT